MSPFALSAVMLGRGLMLSLWRLEPRLYGTWGLPIIQHSLLAPPFVLRALLPAHRPLDPKYAEVAATLGRSTLNRLWNVQLPLLRAPLVSAFALSLAISL